MLNVNTMTSGMWYKALLENHATHENTTSGQKLIPCRTEVKHPGVEWERVWKMSVTPGLPSKHLSFLWKMLHDLLPTQERLFRMKMPNATSNHCNLCDQNVPGILVHSLLLCPYNNEAGQFLLDVLDQVFPNLLPHKVVLLDFDAEEQLHLPMVYLIADILSQIWLCRKEKKPCHLASIKSTLEASVNIMRKSRHYEAAIKISTMIS